MTSPIRSHTTNIQAPSADSPRIINSLKIASINVNSSISLNKRQDLLSFTNNNNNLDIILLGDTKLSKKLKIQFSQYDLIRIDRNNAHIGEGVARLIKQSIPYTHIYSPSSINNIILEFAIINLKVAYHNLFIIAANANNNASRIFVDEVNLLFNKLKLESPDNYYIIAGDFNSRHTKWNDSACNKKRPLFTQMVRKRRHKFSL